VDLELLAPDATGARRIYLSDRSGHRFGFGLRLLYRPQRVKYLLDVCLDLCGRCCRGKFLEVDPICFLDDGDAHGDALVCPEMFPARHPRVG